MPDPRNDETTASQAGYSSVNKNGILYKIAAASALIIVVFIPVQALIFVLWPPPSDVTGWFVLFRDNKLLGLLDMDLLLIVDYILTLLVFIVLWDVLRGYNELLAMVALVFQTASCATYFASAGAFEMMDLSRLYFSAPGYPQREAALAAGQAVLSGWQGTAFNVSYILGCLAMITICIAMLKSALFSKAVSYTGLVSGILMILPPTAGLPGMVLSFSSLVPALAWLVMVAFKLLRLAKNSGSVVDERRVP